MLHNKDNVVDPDHIYMRTLTALMEERDVIAMRNKIHSASDNQNTNPGATLAGHITPGGTGLAPGFPPGSCVPSQPDKTTGTGEPGIPGSVSSAATTRAASSVAQSRASSKTTLGGRNDPKTGRKGFNMRRPLEKIRSLSS